MYDRSNRIHPTAIIDDTVKMGKNNVIGAFTVICSNVTLGDSNLISSHVSIGQAAQHRDELDGDCPVFIGSNNKIREFVTIHAPTNGVTKIGDNCYFMACSHVSHDTVIEDGVTMANGVLLGGKTHVMRGANLGLGSIVHQFSTIGSYSMLGMGTVVPKTASIVPGRIYIGNPVRLLKMNEVGLNRAGVGMIDLVMEEKRYNALLSEKR